MEQPHLTEAHYDLLQAVSDLQGTESNLVSTKAAGQRLLEIYKSRGGGYTWMASPPWHGTNPEAQELRDAGLLEVDPGIAQFRAYNQPAASPSTYYVGLTENGRELLEEHGTG